MADRTGKIVLMGSGELTATMVAVHKGLLEPLGSPPRAAFLDTPAGFQLNADQISSRAAEYFQTHVQQPLAVASYKSHTDISDYERMQAGQVLRQADYILVGPGSPTYALRQLQPSPVPDLLARCVSGGGCLVAASAAALTVGRFTLPVYEIYKVGQALHWVEGLDLLGRFGLNLVVVPHWNNAEGGTHDTRFCFMGGDRFNALAALLPGDLPVLGLDEHTACILDLGSEQVEVKGLGGVTLRLRAGERVFHSGERFALSDLTAGAVIPVRSGDSAPTPAAPPKTDPTTFWDRLHELEARFHAGIDQSDARAVTNALLDLDRIVWQAHQRLEDEAVVAQARDTLRDLIVVLGNELSTSPRQQKASLAPLVDVLLDLRQRLRSERQWAAADALRDALASVGIQVEDTPNGHRWQLTPA
jgi:peptidase E